MTFLGVLGRLGLSWGHLGTSWRGLGGILEASWGILRHLGGILEASWGSWRHPGASWTVLEPLKAKKDLQHKPDRQ